MAMTTNSPSWYIPGQGNKPAGPFTAEQIIESWRAGRLDKNTLCWREGMAKWLPLAQAEPFAAMVQPAAERSRGGGIFRWLAVRLVVLALLVVAAGILYIYWNEWNTIRKVNALIATEDYDEALTILRPFADATYFYRGEASYLSALAATRQFASAANVQELAEDALKRPRRQFHDLFQANERWRERARSDFADIVASVPKKAPDDLARSVAIAYFLEGLKVADAKQLAKQLLAMTRTSIDERHGMVGASATIVKHILLLDPSQSGDVVTAVLPDADELSAEFPARLSLVQGWANDEPSLARPLASALAGRATDLRRAAKDQSAELALGAAEEMCPELRAEFIQKRFGWLRSDLAKKDYTGVVRTLERMLRNNHSVAASTEAAPLLFEVAQEASKLNPAVAQRAIERAFQLQPSLGDSEPNVLLWINLHPGPSSEKLQQCQHFLSAFTTSEQLGRIQLETVRDAAAFAPQDAAGMRMDTWTPPMQRRHRFWRRSLR